MGRAMRLDMSHVSSTVGHGRVGPGPGILKKIKIQTSRVSNLEKIRNLGKIATSYEL